MAHVILVSDLSHHHSTWTPLAERGREISRVYVYVCTNTMFKQMSVAYYWHITGILLAYEFLLVLISYI